MKVPCGVVRSLGIVNQLEDKSGAKAMRVLTRGGNLAEYGSLISLLADSLLSYNKSANNRAFLMKNIF